MGEIVFFALLTNFVMTSPSVLNGRYLTDQFLLLKLCSVAFSIGLTNSDQYNIAEVCPTAGLASMK